MEGTQISPELLRKARAAQSPQELMEACKAEGIELNEKGAERWFGNLNSGELAARLRAPVAEGGCGPTVHCPQCGSANYYQRYIPFDIYGDGMVHCWCDDCGYTHDYY